MDFCPKCESRLTPRKVKSGNQVLFVLACNKCKLKTKEIEQNMKIKGKKIQQLISVIDKENQLTILPTIQVTCTICGNKSAYAWQVQTRGADESSTQFLRCTRCNYTFREYT
jgi:DNA-directed RNA polymerase subunit M